MVTGRTSFGSRLRKALDDQGVSVRELARRIRPDDPETGRRNIARWLAPADKAVTPSEATIRQVAELLDVPVEELAPEDDEESRAMAADLFRALDRYVTHKLAGVGATRALNAAPVSAPAGDLL